MTGTFISLLLVGMKNTMATLESSLTVFTKLNVHLPNDPDTFFLTSTHEK